MGWKACLKNKFDFSLILMRSKAHSTSPKPHSNIFQWFEMQQRQIYLLTIPMKAFFQHFCTSGSTTSVISSWWWDSLVSLLCQANRWNI